MILEQMQVARQGKKLHLQKETVRELKHGKQNAAYPGCEPPDESEEGSIDCDSDDCVPTEE
jgi:hypothetical protein